MDDKIGAWVLEVKRYNRRLHLVSSALEKDLEAGVRQTMSLLEHIPEPQIADLGAGSGLLSIPYKVMNPSFEVALIERSRKKCDFLRHVIDALKLQGIRVIEADPLKESVQPFPAVMSRAFSPKETLAEAVMRVVSTPGCLYYFEAGTPEPIVHPGFERQEHFSKGQGSGRLSLDVYRITSR
ncbi:MAG TPA: class I SAM-dependent methyltransferase [Deltaproteobacteria bacterium]|nr:class I SAM-dependent methyltransferase [Deltaproteobacteria bacterium]HQI01488.1 class I SAM-dependent methyltransferase [Deltaproteobacteria bacterium]